MYTTAQNIKKYITRVNDDDDIEIRNSGDNLHIYKNNFILIFIHFSFFFTIANVKLVWTQFIRDKSLQIIEFKSDPLKKIFKYIYYIYYIYIKYKGK